MNDALFLYLKSERDLAALPPHLHRRALLQWEKHKDQTIRMDREMAFCHEHAVQVICYGDEAYPERLKACPDAPLVLFYRGQANLNARHIVAIVGTRHISPYGKDLCQLITTELACQLPDTLIVSGLAYGIDIHAHRGALKSGLQTIGVLAHGIDRIYPYAHKATAAEMTRQGGLLTEYPTGTMPERYNFVHRNRIVAAMADCTIVVESGSKGGSLITLQRAIDCHRPVLACPGRLTDGTSAGCNLAIAEGRATAFTSVADLLKRMGWTPHAAPQATEQALFPPETDISPEAQSLISLLRGTDGLTADQIAGQTGQPAFAVSAILTDLEMQGLVSILPGGVYRLIGSK